MFAQASDGDAPEAGGERGSPSFSLSNGLSPHTLSQSRTREPPRLERAVISRTQFHIALSTPPLPLEAGKTSVASEAGQRGWSSPHGEPYRPLGRPELNLKFSPRLVYGVSQMQREGGGNANRGATGTGGNADKVKEVRETSSTSNAGTSMMTLVDQFVNSLTCSKWPPDERQVKLAHRLQANVDGFSPEKVRGLYRYKPFAGGDLPHCHQTPHGDTSFQLLREAIDEGTNRLRSIRNGSNFLHLPPPEFFGFHGLHEQYLRARATTQPLMTYGSTTSSRTSPRILVSRETSPRQAIHFSRDENIGLGCPEGDDGQATWYLPYTTRQLQRSPHRNLPSLEKFRVLMRDEKEPLRPLRASSDTKAQSLVRRIRVSRARPSRASVSSSPRNSMAPKLGSLSTVQGDTGDDMLEPNAPALGKGGSSPFAMTIPSSLLPPPASPFHSIEKLQAAVDSLGATKCQQSQRLAIMLKLLEHDRCECLNGKFRRLRVRSDAVSDLTRMREHSERDRQQRVLDVVSKTAVWYPELSRRLFAREGTTNVNSGVQLPPLHAAELFITQAVRRFANDGCEFQSAQLYEILLHLHHDDLKLPQVQQLLEFLRNALHINHEEWTQFFAEHDLPEPTDNFAADHKDSQGFAFGKTGFITANTARVAASMGS